MSTSFTITGDQLFKDSALQRLHMRPDTQVKVEVTESSVILTPIREIMADAELEEIIAELDRDFGSTFRALAK